MAVEAHGRRRAHARTCASARFGRVRAFVRACAHFKSCDLCSPSLSCVRSCAGAPPPGAHVLPRLRTCVRARALAAYNQLTSWPTLQCCCLPAWSTNHRVRRRPNLAFFFFLPVFSLFLSNFLRWVCVRMCA